MEAFRIDGPVKLSGEISPQGAKNEALQIVGAVLLTKEKVIIENLPEIRDVLKLIELLQGLGVKVNRISPNNYSFKADDINLDYLYQDEFYKNASAIRGSLLILGPMLARFGVGVIPKPGGDKIGRRKLDTHFIGLQNLGAEFIYDADAALYNIKATQLKGAYMLLEEASVTGTANVLMAAALAEGTTEIYHAACEPYIQQLCKMLISMGANIEGTGTNYLSIKGVKELGGCTHRCLPDMIEIGSFIGMAAMTQSAITIKNAIPSGLKNITTEHLGIMPEMLRKLGIQFNFQGNDIIVPEQSIYEVDTNIDGSIITISDAPWPGFTPDLLSIALVVATQAKGNVLIHQKMFESRLFFVDNLIEMGAQIILCDPHRATIMGLARKYPLRGISMRSPDIRAGVALLIAALSAEGGSTIQNIAQIDRGYEKIDDRLNAMGAKIQRIKDPN
ncbi:MAG: UDP-N-acetylglucosamine 1-carboxyvinyltransferase [Bacteroidetes bacterium]|nr:UDP-N-acetylglucosamine 1-carboxyvinyltransferase [Bacteroidota bacterium]